jgi:hypothetical protein
MRVLRSSSSANADAREKVEMIAASATAFFIDSSKKVTFSSVTSDVRFKGKLSARRKK